ncbi:hypothetical protein FA95DRAFT_1612448 [Auriscalpium vulgare]|uniref:Uncharacterized protein n=1 Tax=Auriscalpium vulgare TaxID=40419 RepID=A0ACB8R7H8_9AGAM|nr:hypothetical protein FA95DRAFT_1612448 [Auriscalpium vulgare]
MLFLITPVYHLFTFIASLLFSQPSQTDHLQSWFKAQEAIFRRTGVASESQTAYAIQNGSFAGSMDPDWQAVMDKWSDRFTARNMTWPWDQFKGDMLEIGGVCRVTLVGTEANDLAQATLFDIDTVIGRVDDFLNNPVDVQLTFPHITLPDWVKEVLGHVRDNLERARNELQHAIDDASDNLPAVVKAVHDVITAQIALLPQEVRDAIEELKKFREEHPYLAAAAEIVIVTAAGEFIFAPAALSVFRLAGFTKLGPAARSWAALTQSAFYGGRTRGLFSIVQSITMGAKTHWPAAVLMGMTIGGEVVLLERGALRELVDRWRAEGVRPHIGTMLEQEVDETFMREVGDRCMRSGVPLLQWLDVAQQFVVREVEESVGDV